MKTIALITMATCAGLAAANPLSADQSSSFDIDTAGFWAFSITIDISGFQSWDGQGSGLNEHILVNIGVGAQVTGLGWDVTLTTFNGSWGSEAVINFGGQLFLTPGVADGFSVSNANYISGGILDLSDNGIPNVLTDGAGNLDIEFFESFDDIAGTVDGVWGAGSTITIVGFYPAPGALPALGLGGLIVTRRKR